MDTNYFNKAVLYINGECINVENLQWIEHPTFKGVFLKHIIKGEKTNNRLSCHLVKIYPHCEIGNHNHLGKTELHEILFGYGQCFIEETQLDYYKGVIGLIPADKNHRIEADKDGLLLLAKFFPALL